MSINETVDILRNAGFEIPNVPEPDQEHFGNWILLAYRQPFAVRVTNDRGLCLDVARADILNPGLHGRWVTWDVIAECIGVLHNARPPLDALLFNLDAVTKAFSFENWPITKDRLKEIEHAKRQWLMKATE